VSWVVAKFDEVATVSTEVATRCSAAVIQRGIACPLSIAEALLASVAQVAKRSSAPRWALSGRKDSGLSTVSHLRSSNLMKCQEHLARTIAAHMGAQCSAARAVEELDVRRSHGEQVCVFPMRGRWVVEAI
jgi:hypothetical protein